MEQLTITKVCRKCQVSKDTIEFNLRKDSKDGLSYWCRSCSNSHYSLKRHDISLHNKKHYALNKEDINSRRRYLRSLNSETVKAKEKEARALKKDVIAANAKKWREANKEHFKTWRKENYLKNKKNIQEKRRAKRSNDLFYRVSSNVRTRLWHAIKVKNWQKTSTFIKYIGCSRLELICHLESKFLPGMTWNNYGEWHIDHRVPLSSAKTEQDLYTLCHYSNLQPLWASDNIRKGASNGT